MTATPYTDQDPAAREVARAAARNTLRRLLLSHLGDQIPNTIADEVLDAALAQTVADRISTPGAEGWGKPVHWTVYNAMHQRALYAGYTLKNARAACRKVRAHLAGFGDVLDDMDRDAWDRTGGAALTELTELLDDDRPDATTADTLPEWLNHRYGRSPHGWDTLTDDERAYWAHEAAAVRRAVERGGFKTGESTAPAAGTVRPHTA